MIEYTTEERAIVRLPDGRAITIRHTDRHGARALVERIGAVVKTAGDFAREARNLRTTHLLTLGDSVALVRAALDEYRAQAADDAKAQEATQETAESMTCHCPHCATNVTPTLREAHMELHWAYACEACGCEWAFAFDREDES